MFKKYDSFLSIEECNMLLAEVREKKELWSFNPLTHFRILGNCYFHNIVKYGSASANDYMKNEIPLKLHSFFKEKLSTIFDNVQFTNTFGKPGYSITLPDNPQTTLWHYDNELPLFPYEREFPDYNKDLHNYFEGVYTFVIMLSDGDYSFDYYPETNSEYKNSVEEEMENSYCKEHVKLVGDNCTNPNCTLNKYEKIHYKQGTLLIQDTRFLHRASPSEFKNPDDMRVIARGYGLKKNGVVYLFW